MTDPIENRRQARRFEALAFLTRSIAHDVNNHITVVMGQSELTLRRLVDSPEDVAGLRDVIKASEEIEKLIRELTGYAGSGDPLPKGVDLRRLAASLVPELDSDLAPRNLRLRFLPCDRGIEIESREEFVVLAIRCLVESAAEHSPPGTEVRLELIDSEGDIESDARPSVVLRATGQAPRSEETAARDAMSLERAALQRFAERTRGRFEEADEISGSIRFELVLPVLRSVTEDSPRSDQSDSEPGPVQVLIVEDDVAVLGLTTTMLQRIGHCVHSAASGAEAMAKIDELDHIDVLITDSGLPDLGGDEIARHFRARFPTSSILCVSGRDLEASELERYGIDAGSFLLKPFTMDELRRTIERSRR